MSIDEARKNTTQQALGVQIKGVGRTFPGDKKRKPKTVLKDVHLDIQPGEIIALIGASGCGKSTLLRQIGGLDIPTEGQVSIDDVQVNGIDQRCAVAFQEARLLPWRSIFQNVSLGLDEQVEAGQGSQRVKELLALVGLANELDCKPRQISGGMAQRVSLARALARSPGVLLLDEPFGALDALTRMQMHDLLLQIHRVEPATVILVTHDVDEALYLADRIVLLGLDPDTHAGPATVQRIETVPGPRPRDRSDKRLSALRTSLLESLGVKQAA